MKAFIDHLRRAIAILSPFSDSGEAGSLKWDGRFYVPAGKTKYDKYSAMWFATLTVMSELLERQEGPLSGRQKEYLDRALFGGMGSFNDFQLDERQLGAEAREANRDLNEIRNAIFEEFQRL